MMNILGPALSVVFVGSLFGLVLVFLLNPLIIWIAYLIKGNKGGFQAESHPSVSLLIVVRNAEELITDRIKNALSLNYPTEDYEIVVFSDGSTDDTETRAKSFNDRRVKFLSSPNHKGKNDALNSAMQRCSGEIVVFSDADAILDSNAILNLTKYFADRNVGGVCGQRIIYDENKQLRAAQSDYIKFDSLIKKMESHTGSISSNDGKLYAIKKDLFQTIPPGVTDDLYVSLSVIRQKKRFLFTSEAKAYIKVPSRSPKHEISRRRRIVSRSLRGIFLIKELLNPFKYGFFSLRLFINKVLRRFIPIFLFVLLMSSYSLMSYANFFKAVFFLQITFYSLAFSHWAFFQRFSFLKTLRRLSSLTFYFCIGNYGTFLGLVDFLMGRQVVKWEPFKNN
jgi:cellulose synthase/poly-beta-1,6-N-acetylglucosamine synthase-like glycosyltransferase